MILAMNFVLTSVKKTNETGALSQESRRNLQMHLQSNFSPRTIRALVPQHYTLGPHLASHPRYTEEFQSPLHNK